MTAVRRSEGPRPGETNGEWASGKTTKILSHWSGGYQDKYGCTRKGGGGVWGQTRDGHRRNRRAIERFYQQARYPGDDWRQAEGLTISAGGAVSCGHRTNREGTRASEAGAIPGDAWKARYPGDNNWETPGNKTRDSRQCGGRRLLKPLHQHPSQVLSAAQVKGRARAQPSGHCDRQQEQHGTGRQSVSGGRRVTTSATGEATNNRKTDGEEARGGERGMHARAK